MIRLTNWEYWPFGILQGPVFIYWLWLALKARSVFFFSASNPAILAGGMLGESKMDVLGLVPAEVKPKSILIRLPSTTEKLLQLLRDHQLSLPLIFKPDIGERGWMVKQIHTETDIEHYLSRIRIDFIAQELVDLPYEFGVFYVRHPQRPSGEVSSIAMKEFLTVTGDGKKTLRELILDSDRARLQWKELQSAHYDKLADVLSTGEKRELVSIGNHCLGTKFLNANHLITDQLNRSFNAISERIPGFFFGRFDLRCASLDDLESGRIKIVELNGCGAEPAHIYHPGTSFWSAMATLFRHVRIMYEISVANHAKGVPYLTFREGRKIYRRFKSITSS